MPSTKKIKKIEVQATTKGSPKRFLKTLKKISSQDVGLSEEDEENLKKFIKRVIKLRQISNKKQLYEDIGIIKHFIEESILFGQLKLKDRPNGQYLTQFICKLM